nr:GNAT family N-acetyltransferase [Deltaproteobacteria bacterium]
MMTMFTAVTSSKEVKQVSRLAQEIWNEHYVPIIGQDQVTYMLARFQSEQAITEQLTEGCQYYLIVDGKRAVGYVGVVPQPETAHLFISKLYVKSSCRGIGLGKETLAFIEKLCRSLQLKTLTLTVNRHNHRSIAWYQAAGFSIIGPSIQDIGAGFVMDDFRMEKQVE